MPDTRPESRYGQYDERCLELAKHFLFDVAGSTELEAAELAAMFQFIAETFCQSVEMVSAAERAEGEA